MNERVMPVKPEQLLPLTGFINDCWFDRDRIDFDLQTHILKIPFSREKWENRELVRRFLFKKEYRVPEVEYVLRILHVESYKIQEPDKDGPGSSDMLWSIKYDNNQEQLWIETDFTKGIEILVHDFEIYLVQTDRVLRTRTHSVIFEPAIIKEFSDPKAQSSNDSD